jgi:hypothetical protein
MCNICIPNLEAFEDLLRKYHEDIDTIWFYHAKNSI